MLQLVKKRNTLRNEMKWYHHKGSNAEDTAVDAGRVILKLAQCPVPGPRVFLRRAFSFILKLGLSKGAGGKHHSPV